MSLDAMSKLRAEVESRFGPPQRGEGIEEAQVSSESKDESDNEVGRPDPTEPYPERAVDEARALRR